MLYENEPTPLKPTVEAAVKMLGCRHRANQVIARNEFKILDLRLTAMVASSGNPSMLACIL